MTRRLSLSLLVLAGTLLGCEALPDANQDRRFKCDSDADCIEGFVCRENFCTDGSIDWDVDRDGHTRPGAPFGSGADCDDNDPSRSPDQPEIPYDGIDQDCNDQDLWDADGDGYTRTGAPYGTADDCDDLLATTNTDAEDDAGDDVDDDCSGDAFDVDGDGADDVVGTTLDCDDTDAERTPGKTEVPYDGIDQDCSGQDLWDVDGDGYTKLGAPFGSADDCDDALASVNVDAPDDAGDTEDEDCSGDPYDADDDGYDDLVGPQLDCDDADPTRSPELTDIPYDGKDQDCSGQDLWDVDGDGYTKIGAPFGSADDCADDVFTTHPDATDNASDDVDDDCSGDPFDADGDGYDDVVGTGTLDCDDGDATRAPNLTDDAGDAVDEDCSGDPYDEDGDGVDDITDDPPDCDDQDPNRAPGFTDIPYDGTDQDCSGLDLWDVDGDGATAVGAPHGTADDCDDSDARFILACPGDFTTAFSLDAGNDLRIFAVDDFDDGSVVIGGQFRGTITFGPGGANERTFTSSTNHGFVARYASNGSLLWAHHLGGTNGGAMVLDLVVDGNGIIYAVGAFSATDMKIWFDLSPANYGQVGSYEAFLIKVASDGSIVWGDNIQSGSAVYAEAVDVSPDNSRIYVGGRFAAAGTPQFGVERKGVAGISSGYDMFLAAYTPTRSVPWLHGSGGPGDDLWVGVAATDTHVALAGYGGQNIRLGPGQATEITLAGSSGADGVVSYWDNTGKFLWGRGFATGGDDRLADVDVDSTGNLFVVGNFSNSLTLGPGETNETTVSSAGGTDLVLASFATDGTLRFATSGGGPENEWPSALEVTAEGLLVGTAFTTGATFGVGTATETTLTAVGGLDAAILRFDPNGALEWGRSYGSTGADTVYGLALVSGGPNLVAVGHLTGSATFAPTEATSVTVTITGTTGGYLSWWTGGY